MNSNMKRCGDCYRPQPGPARFCNHCGYQFADFEIFEVPKRNYGPIVIGVVIGLFIFAVALGSIVGPQSSKSSPSSASTSQTPSLPATYASLDPVAGFQAKVIGVTDGDTITVLTDTRETKTIRLAGIDAPELGQDFGRKSKKNLSDLIMNAQVQLVGEKIDRHGRTVANVYLDGKDINLEQVKSGFAWHFKEFAREQSTDDQKAYADAEIQARSSKENLWSMPNPIAPWDFRKGTGIDPELKDKFIANSNSGIYHWFGCPGFAKTSEKNRVVFDTWEAAEAEGYRAATNCKTAKPETPIDSTTDTYVTEAYTSPEVRQFIAPIPAPTPIPYLPKATPYPRTYSSGGDEVEANGYYTSPVPRGTHQGIPKAICADGTVSYSQNDSGTCSKHGGVSSWLNDEPNTTRTYTPKNTYSNPYPSYTPRTSTPTWDPRPKTVHVDGYTRRDGTYVRPHTRRAPRRN